MNSMDGPFSSMKEITFIFILERRLKTDGCGVWVFVRPLATEGGGKSDISKNCLKLYF